MSGGTPSPIQHRQELGRTSLNVRGELDVATLPRLRFALHRVLDRPPHELRIDLTNVRFMDAGTLGLLAWMSARLRALGCQVVIRTQPRHGRLFRQVGLGRLLHRGYVSAGAERPFDHPAGR
jgi:anti-anti-sigma factor